MDQSSPKQQAEKGTLPVPIQSAPGQFRLVAVIAGLSVLVLAILMAVGRVHHWQSSPDIYLLEDHGQARWIRARHAFNLGQHNSAWTRETMFRYQFELDRPVANAEITLNAFRRCHLWVDTDPRSAPLQSTSMDFRHWRSPLVIRLDRPLNPGRHELRLFVSNQTAHSCVQVSSPDLGVYSGTAWETQEGDGDWMPAVLVNETTSTVPAQIRDLGYVPVIQSVQRIWPVVAFIFVGAIGVAWLTRSRIGNEPGWYLQISSDRIRTVLLIAWCILGINNLGRIPPSFGYDAPEHVDYVKYIVANNRLPLANDGWQMFQSPLMYVLAAPFYLLSTALLGADRGEQALRILPLLCGLAQIEIVFRATRVLFPGEDDRQIVGTLVGSMLPMNLYMSQVFGNEPLAGVMTALVILTCLTLLVNPDKQRGSGFYCLLGGLWGLALLSKVTPIILAPLLVAVVCYHAVVVDQSWLLGLTRTAVTFGTGGLVAGWYFIRNWVLLGRPFVGGWDSSRGIQWWQDPSFRTWPQFTTFGRSLIQPIYSGVLSFWDALFTTIWADGFLSGSSMPVDKIPWNADWMAVGIWLAAIPIGCIAISLVTIGMYNLRAARPSLLFAAATIGIYITAILDLSMQVPVYGSGKGSYALGLIPCFGILAAAGAGPLLRMAFVRETTIALVTTWAVTCYLSYFCIR